MFIWCGCDVKIEDVVIVIVWVVVGVEKVKLVDKLLLVGFLVFRELVGVYDDILVISQDVVDVIKQVIDEFKFEGVLQSDFCMQSFQIIRIVVNYEMISWCIGCNCVLIGQDDGVWLDFSVFSKKKKK